jgi:hypothetical protein
MAADDRRLLRHDVLIARLRRARRRMHARVALRVRLLHMGRPR